MQCVPGTTSICGVANGQESVWFLPFYLLVMALLFTVLISTSAAVPVPWTMVFEKKMKPCRVTGDPQKVTGLLSHTSSVLVQIDHQMRKDMVTTGRVQVKLKHATQNQAQKVSLGIVDLLCQYALVYLLGVEC
jgi:hypothetical protein